MAIFLLTILFFLQELLFDFFKALYSSAVDVELVVVYYALEVDCLCFGALKSRDLKLLARGLEDVFVSSSSLREIGINIS